MSGRVIDGELAAASEAAQVQTAEIERLTAIISRTAAKRDELGEMLTAVQDVHAAELARVRAELERVKAEAERRDAKLGRVVAALRDAKPYVNGASSYIGESRRVATEIDAVFSDEDSVAAGEVWITGQRRYCPACGLLYADAGDAARSGFSGGEHLCWTRSAECKAAAVLTLKVDARRRKCGCQETYPQVQPGRVNHGPGCARRGGGA